MKIRQILLDEGFTTTVRVEPPVDERVCEDLTWIARQGFGPLSLPGFEGWWITVDYPRDAEGRILPDGATFRLHRGASAPCTR